MTDTYRNKRARLVSGDVYATPGAVLTDRALSESKRIEVLRRWGHDASEINVAEDDVGLDQMLQALRHLVADIDTGHNPPTEQGGFDRESGKPSPTQT
jgi:hypothetical protein